MRRFVLLLLAGWAVLSPAPVRAVILFRTGDPAENTAAPTGALANSGWQFQGLFGPYTGTPIAPNLFLTAQHIRGEAGVGTPFVFANVTYATVAEYNDPASDLRIMRVDGVFPTFAPLFTRLNPAGEPLVVFGRGTRRGDPVNLPDAAPGGGVHLAGWSWGTGDSILRYGTNTVEGILDGGPGLGRWLYATFDATGGGPEEAHLSVGDSGGGVFVRDPADGVWKLAGINYGVSGPYSASADGAGRFFAALFNPDGLFEDNGSAGFLPASGPGVLVASEVAAHLDFIRVVTGETPLARIGSDVLFGFASESGKRYRIERCDDLAAGIWTTLAADVPGNGGRVLVTDPGGVGQPRRFYRAVTLP